MNNLKTMETTSNKYVQGSIWHWGNRRERKPGVQSDARPVLIVSNNVFNYSSPSVNAVSITTVLKDSPVHVPVHISTESHIQCEQIHTISKTELGEFMGMVSDSILSAVKAKIKYQIDISEEKDTQLLLSLRKGMDELRKRADSDPKLEMNTKLDLLLELAEKGFGLPAIEEEFIKLMLELHKSFEKVAIDVENLKSQNGQVVTKEADVSTITTKFEMWQTAQKEDKAVSPDAESDAAPIPITSAESSNSKGERAQYTDEDKRFIADSNNSLDELMKKYGFKDKKAASNKRSYFRAELRPGNKSDLSDIPKTKSKIDKPQAVKYRHYSNEDRAFILNKRNSIEVIMQKFGFKDKNAAYKARQYIKKISAEAQGT